VPSPTGGTLYYDSTENALSYKPITPSNDVTVNLGQESLIRIYNNLGVQINNGQALHITGATSGAPTVSLAIATGGSAKQFQISGIATHDIPSSSYGFMTVFGVVRDINLTGFSVGEQVYLSQTVAGDFASYSDLFYTGRTCEVGHVIDNSSNGKLSVALLNEIEGTIITTLENNILTANNSSTGIFQFSGLSIDTPSGTTFSVGQVEGWIIDNVTAPANPTIQLIIYSGSSGNTSLYYSSATETYILLTSASTITQQTSFPTPQQRRQNLYLGKFGHGNKEFLINAFNEPDSVLSPLSQLRDMFTPIKLINSGVIPSDNGANLTFNTSAGILYGLGIGYVTNKLNPNSLSVSGQSPTTFQYRTQTGGTATNRTTIDPNNYDLNGVVTPIGSTKATNQRIYLLQNGQIRIQYGQTEYNTITAAIAAVQKEEFVTFPNFVDNAILIGVLSVIRNASSLIDPNDAQFFVVSKFGEVVGAAGGTSTTTLQQAYNNSSSPAEIITNSTLGALHIQNGSGADNVSKIFDVFNSGGTSTAFMRADGLISGSSVSAPTISATTYFGLPNTIYTGDGTIVSDRTVNLSSYTLNFSSSTAPNNLVLSGGNVGIGTSAPQHPLHIVTTECSLRFTNADSGGAFVLSGNSGIPRFDIGSNVGDVFSFGVVASGVTAPTYAARGKATDSYIRASVISNGLNIINAAGSSMEDYIRFYAGKNANSGDPDLHIQGSGSTRGFIGINVSSPTNRLHISATSDPVRFVGITADTRDTNLVSIDSSGVLHSYPLSGITGSSSTFTGGTVTGATSFTNGLTANTISATTYQNLPTYVSAVTESENVFTVTTNTGNTTLTVDAVTGGSYSNGTITLSGTGTFSPSISGFPTTFTNNYLPLSGGTVTGQTTLSAMTTVYGDTPTSAAIKPGLDNTYDLGQPSFRWREIFTTNIDISNSTSTYGLYVGNNLSVVNNLVISGNTTLQSLTASTISATTYQNLPTYVSAVTESENVFTVTTNTGNTTLTVDAVTGGTFNSVSGIITLSGTGSVNGTQITGLSTGSGGSFTGGTVSGATNFTNGLTANTISATTYENVNAVTGGTYNSVAGVITLSGTGNVNGNTITGFSTGSGGLTWQFATTSITASTNNGYITTGTTSIALPTTATLGSTIEVVSTSSNLFTITQNTNQFIRFGIITTTPTSGTLISQNIGDSIRLVCTSADTVFTVVSAVGNITII